MANKVRCPECSQRVNVRKMHVGELFDCQHCQARLRVPPGAVGIAELVYSGEQQTQSNAPDDMCHVCNRRGIPGSPQGLRATNYTCRECGAPVPAWMREEALGKEEQQSGKGKQKGQKAAQAAGSQRSPAQPVSHNQKAAPSQPPATGAKTVRCPKCSQLVSAEKITAGQLFKCTYCNTQLRMPGAQSQTASINDSSSQPAKPAPPIPQSWQDAWTQLSIPHLVSEIYDAQSQRRVLRRLLDHLEQGMRDPELLYLGGRYAATLGLEREACRFLDPLADMLCDGEQLSPAYFPVGLLYLQVLTDEKRRSGVLQQLQQLAASSPKLTNALRLAGYDPAGDVPANSPPHLLLNIEHNKYGTSDEILVLARTEATGSNGSHNSIREIQQLARRAQQNYGAGKLAAARDALEDILLLDGDQPDALRNLITVTSEQQDIEAYERYWRRYIKVLLWRIMRGDDVRAALEDLVRFYSRVATVTDREFGDSSSKTSERLKTPGLLSRWLEANAALVWLEAATQPAATLSANPSGNGNAGGQFSYAPLMKFWYRVFYPEFYAYLDVDSHSPLTGASRGALARTSLTFDPALKLLTRFAEWAQFYFFIGDTYDAYAETLTALAGCVARLPIQPYVLELKAKFEVDELKPRPFRRSLQEACSGPLFLKRNKLRDAEDWPGLIEFLGDEEILDRLTPVNRLWLAYALCKAERQEEGLEIACRTLPEMLPEEFEKDTFTEGLFSAIVNLNVAKVIPDEGPVIEKGFANFVNRLRAVPHLAAAPDFINSVVEPILFEKTFRDTQSLIEQGNYEAAKKALRQLPATTDKARERKKEWLQQIDVIEERERNSKLIDQLLDQAKELVGEGKYAEAKKKVNQLPGKSDEVAELRQSWLSEIEKIEERERNNKLIDGILTKAKKLVEQKKFSEAKKEVRRLPSNTDELRELRDDWIKQIEEVEQREKLDAQIDSTIARAKDLIARDNFTEARRVVKQLPDTTYTRELRNNLLSQIDDVEKQAKESAKLRTLIDRTFDKVQAYINMASFNDAVLSVYDLPDEPEEIEKIKDKWLADIKRLAPPGAYLPALKARPRRKGAKSSPFDIPGLNDFGLSSMLASPLLGRMCYRCHTDNTANVSKCYKCGNRF